MTEGLDTGALARWIDAERPGVLDTSGPLTATLITGGKSNLTYRVSDGAREIIARRPPLGHVLATAHDMSREYRVMSALADTSVPVPATYGLCQDDSVIGAPFYLMESVAGTPFQRAEQLEKLGEERTRAISERLVDTLAALHEVDYTAVGLEEFGRPDGYLERQVRRWKKQLDASRSREIDGIDELYARLERSIPQSGDGTIVHGDYRLDNALVDDADQITAVLDWEMSTLGDPLTDVALMVAYQNLALHDSGDSPASVTDAPKAPGYLSVDAVIDRYATTSGRDLGELGFHLGLAYFKLAVILEGIYYRYIHGQTLGEGFDHIGDSIFPLVQHGLDATA
ncbi:phosphotransferase family protein [Aeromicrobium sp. YIM 150415]|uniref:phosphotransferase family protein n=1 Tax=Aeromicrobium sp. YIM 150415 TaxID=2803912 RepID=UPI0019634AB3|nr:phosphotransferase family protein [Aeromicrobium sp. YIM 150415]MBM9463211.1 phosphotransferase family protein [Aeromicrobium sp. YIM 150415]